MICSEFVGMLMKKKAEHSALKGKRSGTIDIEFSLCLTSSKMGDTSAIETGKNWPKIRAK